MFAYKSGGGSAWNSGLEPSVQILEGDGFLEFEATDTGYYRAIGFSDRGSLSVHFNTIEHGVYLKGGGTPTQFAIVETGVERATGTYAIGDIFRVHRIGTAITYYQNGTLVWASAVAAAGDRMIDGAFSNRRGSR